MGAAHFIPGGNLSMRMPIKAAVVATATSALLVPAAAMAASETVKDATDDTFTVTYDPETGDAAYEASDVTTNVDIVKTTVAFGKTVKVTVVFDKLSKKGIDFRTGVSLKTDKTDKNDLLYLDAGAYKDDKGNWQDSGFLITGPQSGRTAHGTARRADCQKADTDVDWKAGVLTVSAPSSCFGKAKWVTAHVNGFSYTSDESGDNWTYYVDDAHSKKSHSNIWTDKIKKG